MSHPVENRFCKLAAAEALTLPALLWTGSNLGELLILQ